MADDPVGARSRLAAGALIRDPEGRVLLVRPTYKPGWEIPGGLVEPGESPAAACTRELEEELGICRTPGALLVVDWAPRADVGDLVLFVFDGGTMTPEEATALTPDGVEISEARFHDAADVPALVPDRLARRLAVALAAAQDGRGVYAEHGIAP
jgi:8-oxo-dGTP diphosphatase